MAKEGRQERESKARKGLMVHFIGCKKNLDRLFDSLMNQFLIRQAIQFRNKNRLGNQSAWV